MLPLPPPASATSLWATRRAGMKAETTKRALSPIVTPCFWDISPADLWLPPPLSPPPLPWVTDRKSAETSQSLWEVTATTRPASASAPPLHSQDFPSKATPVPPLLSCSSQPPPPLTPPPPPLS